MHNKLQIPINRIVLLGASNLTFSLRTIIQLLQQYIGAPSDVLVAAGHGRSYGQNSQLLMRELPGIVHSGLWQQLYADKSLPVYALLTDIGNDIPYGYLPEQIMGWVQECIQQLLRQDARIVMTNLPIASIQSLPEYRFNVLRRLLFPTCELSRDDVIERAWHVHQGLNELAARYSLKLYEIEPKWMGADGIHVSLWKCRGFYQQFIEDIASAWGLDEHSGCASDLLWRQKPQFAVRKLFGRTSHAVQPSGYFSNRTTVSLY